MLSIWFFATCQVYPYFPNNIWPMLNKYLEEQHWLIILEPSHLRRQFNLFSKIFREIFLYSPIYMRGFIFFQPSLPSTLSFFHFKILNLTPSLSLYSYDCEVNIVSGS